MTAQRFVPWTPEEDKLLTEAVVACEFIPPDLDEPAYNGATGGPKICWKFVAKSMSGAFNRRLSFSLALTDGV